MKYVLVASEVAEDWRRDVQLQCVVQIQIQNYEDETAATVTTTTTAASAAATRTTASWRRTGFAGGAAPFLRPIHGDGGKNC